MKEELFTYEYFEKVLFEGEKVSISQSVLDKIDESYRFVEQFSVDKVIYGINTGFGPMAPYHIDDADRRQLQYNLIRSHCSGSGNHIPPLYVKSAMLCRLVNIMQAKSGIHPDCALLLRDLINNDITPVMFEHGGVGASGDLVQLAHLALCMIGEGDVYYHGELMPAVEAMNQCGLKPVDIHLRDGLSLINGTSVMTGISVVNLLYTNKLFGWALMAGSMLNEMDDAYDDSFSKELNSAKRHKGQQDVAAAMRDILSGSRLIRKRQNHLYNRIVTEKVMNEKVQEYYSLRCIPQILGAVCDTIRYTAEIVNNEVNSSNDNPVVDITTSNVYHGGNFHGDYISLEMDKLKIVVTRVAMLVERQLNYLLNPKLNEKFAPFVNLGTPGLTLGMQGVQFTATSTTAECQTLSYPNYVHSIPNNNDNQDIVSMGTNSALITRKVIENAFEVLSVYYMALIQGIDNIRATGEMAEATVAVYHTMRSLVPAFAEDQVHYKNIAVIKQYLMNHNPQIKNLKIL